MGSLEGWIACKFTTGFSDASTSTSNNCGELIRTSTGVESFDSVYWSLEILTFNIVSGTLTDERTLASNEKYNVRHLA